MRTTLLLAVLLAAPIALVAVPASEAAVCGRTSTGLVALSDLGTGTWSGHQGGLYPGGSHQRPAGHTQLGEALATLAVPRDLAGNPDPVLGRSVFLSIGMSNTRSEFQQFVALANADPQRHPQVVAVNGAIGGQDAARISDPLAPYWVDVIEILLGQGLSPLQVNAIWLKEALAGPRGDAAEHARTLQTELREIVQNLRLYFPNANLVYLSSRIYAGYASSGLNPEPYAYASGFSVKWLIGEQLASPVPFASLADPAHGVLQPWLSWGPYLWADGLAARSDGLTWACAEFAADGTHPNAAGSRKVAQQLLDFVRTDSTARIWYAQGGLGLPLAG